MTKEQLAEMFLAQDAWDRAVISEDALAVLSATLVKLTEAIAKLNELLKP